MSSRVGSHTMAHGWLVCIQLYKSYQENIWDHASGTLIVEMGINEWLGQEYFLRTMCTIDSATNSHHRHLGFDYIMVYMP
jgi:hypothetical protein